VTITRGRYRRPFEQLAEELLRRILIPAALQQDIQHVPVLIHSPPQIVTIALDRQKYFTSHPAADDGDAVDSHTLLKNRAS
jgi:hypothetical protein